MIRFPFGSPAGLTTTLTPALNPHNSNSIGFDMSSGGVGWGFCNTATSPVQGGLYTGGYQFNEQFVIVDLSQSLITGNVTLQITTKDGSAPPPQNALSLVTVNGVVLDGNNFFSYGPDAPSKSGFWVFSPVGNMFPSGPGVPVSISAQ